MSKFDMEQIKILRSPDKGKTKGKATIIVRDGKVYLQPGTELHPPEATMTPKNKSRREEIIKNGLGYLDKNGIVVLKEEYQINSEENAWRLVMGSNDGNAKWKPEENKLKSINFDQTDKEVGMDECMYKFVKIRPLIF